jgi:hypothetical protein
MLVLVILVVTCAEISITLAYFQLTNEVENAWCIVVVVHYKAEA